MKQDARHLEKITPGVYVINQSDIPEGMEWPMGTPGMPTRGAANALTIATARKLKKIYVGVSFLVPSDVANLGFEALSNRWLDDIDCNGKVMSNCTFTGLLIYGNGTNLSACKFLDCRVISSLGSYPTLRRCAVSFGPVSFSQQGWFFDCYFDNAVQLSLVSAVGICRLIGCSGDVTIKNMPAGVTLDIYGDGLVVRLDATDVGGTINVYGDTKVVGATGGTTVNDYSLEAGVALIKTQTDKLAGAAPAAGSVVANWQSGVATSGEAGADLVTIGANDTRNKLHSLLVSIHTLTNLAVITVRMYQQVDGIVQKVYEGQFTKGVDPNGLWIVNGTVGIHEALRVEIQSNQAGDNGLAVHYDYMLEAM